MVEGIIKVIGHRIHAVEAVEAMKMMRSVMVMTKVIGIYSRFTIISIFYLRIEGVEVGAISVSLIHKESPFRMIYFIV